MTALFYANPEEKALAETSKKAKETELKTEVFVKILPLGFWTNAEDYHQKYYLRNAKKGALVQTLQLSDEDILNSTLAARLNGFTHGHGNFNLFKADLDKIASLDEKQKKYIFEYFEKYFK